MSGEIHQAGREITGGRSSVSDRDGGDGRRIQSIQTAQLEGAGSDAGIPGNLPIGTIAVTREIKVVCVEDVGRVTEIDEVGDVSVRRIQSDVRGDDRRCLSQISLGSRLGGTGIIFRITDPEDAGAQVGVELRQSRHRQGGIVAEIIRGMVTQLEVGVGSIARSANRESSCARDGKFGRGGRGSIDANRDTTGDVQFLPSTNDNRADGRAIGLNDQRIEICIAVAQVELGAAGCRQRAHRKAGKGVISSIDEDAGALDRSSTGVGRSRSDRQRARRDRHATIVRQRTHGKDARAGLGQRGGSGHVAAEGERVGRDGEGRVARNRQRRRADAETAPTGGEVEGTGDRAGARAGQDLGAAGRVVQRAARDRERSAAQGASGVQVQGAGGHRQAAREGVGPGKRERSSHQRSRGETVVAAEGGRPRIDGDRTANRRIITGSRQRAAVERQGATDGVRAG